MLENHRSSKPDWIEVGHVARADSFDQRNGASEVDKLAAQDDGPVINRPHHVVRKSAIRKNAIRNVSRPDSGIECHAEQDIDELVNRRHVSARLDDSKIVKAANDSIGV